MTFREKNLRDIILLPDIKALPFLPAHCRSSPCSLCHFHIRTLSDHSSSVPASKKSASPGKTPRRHALISHSLRWHYPNQVRSKIYLPLSLSHKLPLALFFSVFQYSTHLSRCQTSIAYCSLHSRRRLTVHSVLSNAGTFPDSVKQLFWHKKTPCFTTFHSKTGSI